MEHVDGNAIAGALAEIFAIDATSAVGTCVTCGRVGAVATLTVYRPAMGLVARCPGCDEVILRVVEGPDCTWLDLRGSVNLRFPR
jgi:hypothetical protein